MLELDWFLVRFFDAHYETLKPEMQQQFHRLLQREDVELHAWLTQKTPAPFEFQTIIYTIQTVCHALTDTTLS